MNGASCPLCRSERSGSLRRGSRDLRRCRDCGAVFNCGWHPLSYDDRYFLEDYRAQYGRTYGEDFDNIYRLSMRRLDAMAGVWGRGKIRKATSLLDIGSALGFFLKAAGDSGIGSLQGIEISRYASDYAAREFGIPVINAPFDEAVLPERFDIITAWYFLEHCEDPRKTVGRIYGLLNPGGLFAFSTPSLFGPQFLLRRSAWADSHPVDHRIDFSPRSVRNLLRQEGFRKIVTRPAGIHPERVLTKESIFFPVFRLLYSNFSSMTSFSDTMEIFAVK